MKDKYCWNCDKQYTPTGKNQKYCSKCRVIKDNEAEMNRYYRLMADPKKRKELQEKWKKKKIKNPKNKELKNKIRRLRKSIWRAELKIKIYEKEINSS